MQVFFIPAGKLPDTIDRGDVARPELPALSGYPAETGIKPLVTTTPMWEREKKDGLIEGARLDESPVDTGPMVTPVTTIEPVVLMFRQERHIRRHECSNGLIYEDAPYHGDSDNPIKSKAPTNPKVSLESSIPINLATTERRVSYDKATGEICVFDNTFDNIYHGHVTSWDKLEQRVKNVLIKHFGFKPNGKPKLVGE